MSIDLFYIVYMYLLINVLYIYLTRSTKSIIFKQKFLLMQWGCTQYVLVDSTGQIYYLSTSLWFGRPNSIDQWAKIKLNKKYTINYYGLNSQVLGTKSQIIDVF